MPLLTAPQIKVVVALMKVRSQHLYHACQLEDFCSYVKLQAIPSRKALKESGLPYTSFQTDDIDHKNGIWNRVFFNLLDSGYWFFSRGNNKFSLPNPYGPILLKVNPDAVQNASDACVSLVSASKPGFNRDEDGLRPDQIDTLYMRWPPNENNATGKWVPKIGRYLEETFPEKEDIATPEMHCTVPTDKIPFANHVGKIIVDPIPGLSDRVSSILQEKGLKVSVEDREAYFHETKRLTYAELLKCIYLGGRTIENFLATAELSDGSREWAEGVRQRWDPDSFQFGRFSGYLADGTLKYF